MKRKGKIILGVAAGYLLMLLLLLWAEGRSADASITGFWDAVWFSLITMTTVGYGDMSPVTPLGRIVGILFALFSLGLFSALIGVGISFLTGRLRPLYLLKNNRRKTWYVFNDENPDTVLLAGKLSAQGEDCLVLFPPADGKPAAEGNRVRFIADAEGLLSLRKGSAAGLSVFLMKEDGRENYLDSLAFTERGVETYCMTDVAAEGVPKELHLFSRTECLSRCYWTSRPLSQEERSVVLIGCGAAGAELLEHGLLTNVFEPGRSTVYTVFDDTADFARIHHELVSSLAEGESGDRLLFPEGSWKDRPDLLSAADRIILCYDDDRANVEAYDVLKTWYPTGAKIHVRLESPLPGIPAFGTGEEIISPESVMKDALNRRAMMINDLYNAGSEHAVAWNDLSYLTRQANVAAADHLMVKVRWLLKDEALTELTPEIRRAAAAAYAALDGDAVTLTEEIEHRRWMRFQLMYNWRLGEPRSNAARIHPSLKPFGELSRAEQRKDDYAWEILSLLKD